MRLYKMLYKGRQFGTCHAHSEIGALSVCAVNAKCMYAPLALLASVALDCAAVDVLAEESKFLSQMAGPVKQQIVAAQAKAMEMRQGYPLLRLTRIVNQRYVRERLEVLKQWKN